jgi:uncharacterized protein (TIGR02466 family)
LVREALEQSPRDPHVLRTLADVALVLQDFASAADLVEGAIAHHRAGAAPATWYRVLGETRTMQGKLGAAIRAFRSALAAAPNDADTWRWLGRVLRTVGDLPGAIAASRQVLELIPDDWRARSDLGVLLTEMRAFDEAAVLFDQAAARAGGAPAIIVSKAKLDARRGRADDAIAALESCVARHPKHTPAMAALAHVLRDERRFDEALAAFRSALALAPTEASLWCGLGRTLLENGQSDEALVVASSYLARRPGYSGALALESLARLGIGDAEGAEHLLDYDRFVVSRELPLPDGFADLTSFNAALAATAAAHPTLLRAPLSHATASGLHSGSLLVEPHESTIALQTSLNVAVADYCRALPHLPGHPFVSHQPKSAFFDIWCVVLERGGHQIPHIHPEAWLSGVYYAELPQAVRAGPGPHGWLEFGDADRAFPRRVEPRIVRVQPKEGLLVLFPSYFYHRTIPFDTDGTRISVAFDLVPTHS